MNAEDWSVRLPETAEWCYRVAEERDLDFDDMFPELNWLRNYAVFPDGKHLLDASKINIEMT
jgi:hypothetical protein